MGEGIHAPCATANDGYAVFGEHPGAFLCNAGSFLRRHARAHNPDGLLIQQSEVSFGEKQKGGIFAEMGLQGGRIGRCSGENRDDSVFFQRLKKRNGPFSHTRITRVNEFRQPLLTAGKQGQEFRERFSQQGSKTRFLLSKTGEYKPERDIARTGNQL